MNVSIASDVSVDIRLTLHQGRSELSCSNFAPSYFPAMRLVCVLIGWDLPKAARLSQRPAASSHPGKRANTEERMGSG